MDKRIIVHVVNATRCALDVHGYPETRYHCIIFMYADGAWEEVFKYTNSSVRKYTLGPRLIGLTRQRGIDRLEKAYYNGKLDGRFMDY